MRCYLSSLPAVLDVVQTHGIKLQWFDAAHSDYERMDICQCKHPSSPRGRPSLISANTSGIPQNTTYVHHVLVGAALRVAYGEEKIVSAWWRRIDLLQKRSRLQIYRPCERRPPASPRPTAPHCTLQSPGSFGPSTTRGARGRKITHTSCNPP